VEKSRQTPAWGGAGGAPRAPAEARAFDSREGSPTPPALRWAGCPPLGAVPAAAPPPPAAPRGHAV